jgi:PPOX class probable F420-dependent enzyme
MHVMSEEEWKAFLTAEPARTGKLATVRKDGRPHVAPIWFDLDDDGSVVFTTGADTLKGRSIRRDARVCLCVDDERPPFSFVIVEGKVEVGEDPDALLVWATRIGGRYMGADRAEAYGRRNAVPGELLVRFRPTHVVARAGIAD